MLSPTGDHFFCFCFCASHPFFRSACETLNYFWLGSDGIVDRYGLVLCVYRSNAWSVFVVHCQVAVVMMILIDMVLVGWFGGSVFC